MSIKNKVVGCSVGAIITIVIAAYGTEIRTSEGGLRLIGDAEGCTRNTYVCPAGVLTHGIGFTKKVPPSKIFTDEEIAERWVEYIKKAEIVVNKYADGKNLPQGAFDASVSMVFNLGEKSMKTSSMFAYFRDGKIEKGCAQILRWKFVQKKDCSVRENGCYGIWLRRNEEYKLCLQGVR